MTKIQTVGAGKITHFHSTLNEYCIEVFVCHGTNATIIWVLVTRKCRNCLQKYSSFKADWITHTLSLYYEADNTNLVRIYDDVMKWKHFPRHWSFVRGINRWPVKSPHKGQWCELSCSLWSAFEQMSEWTIKTLVISDFIALIMTPL